MPNRLAREKSPYLLQHANNPVDWYPWGEEAFARAKAENKPIFLSIGYSTCHWCHVMERESFESDEVAALMNKLFVNIKVDREERPDVDRVYMTFVQATTGGGGWPMSVWLTPELKPFYGGTYFPPRDNYGRPGFPTVLEAIARTWDEKRADVLESANDVVERLRGLRGASGAKERAKLSTDTLKSGGHVFAHAYDAEHGGFGNAPKFPRPVVLTFLLAEHVRRKDPHSLAMVVKTLQEMSAGGMYDHLGGGFHRYSVDRFWHVPHFEKMLYDQAQLVDALVDAWQLTGDDGFARVIRETCEYVLRDLTDASTGGFYSAEDADSPVPGSADPHERAEGAFYVFTDEEIGTLLDADAAKLFRAAYAIEAEGNADDPHGELTGKNVLHRGNAKLSAAEEASLAASRAKLLAHRNTRPRPHLDDKILCAWNGLMIGALARAARALGEPRWLAAASRAADFVLTTLWKDGELLRRYREGEAAFEAHLEDHAALARGLTDLHEASLEKKYLDAAAAIVDRMNALFWDDSEGGWFDTSGRDPSVLLRSKDDYDGAEPAGNSLAALVSIRLAEHTGRDAWRENAARAVAFFSARMSEQPHAAPLMLTAFGWLLDGPTHVVIAGDKGAEVMREVIDRAYIPRRVVLRSGDASWTADMHSRNDSATVYVCRDRACERPVNSPAELKELLSRLAPAAS